MTAQYAPLAAVVTAAGEGARMGTLKPLLPWHGVTLVEYQASSLLEAGVSEVVVVLGHRHEEIVPHVVGRGVYYAVNDNYRQGKSTSVKAGVGSVGLDSAAILLLAVDQPRTVPILSALIESHVRARALITVPTYRGRGGHPLIFSSALRAEIMGITEERQGIREVFREHRGDVNEVPCDSPIVNLDLNTPKDYREARGLYGA